MISVIIPTYDEAGTIYETIERTISHTYKNDFEIIIVDSSDDNETIKAAKKHNLKNVKIFKSERGRAVQMNSGARRAKGDVLLFLHSDNILPPHWDLRVQTAIQAGFEYGCFLKEFDKDGFLLKLLERFSDFKVKFFKEILGDNALFVKKKEFNALKGFQEIALMEDVEISKRLKRFRMKVIKERTLISSRTFKKYGTLKTLLLMSKLRLLYRLGVAPDKLRKMYD